MAHAPSGDNITRLILQGGEIAADRARRSGEMWGSALSGIGQTVGGVIQRRAAATEMAKRDAALTQAIESWDGNDPRALYQQVSRITDPKSAMSLTQGVIAFSRLGNEQDPKERQANFEMTLKTAAELPFPMLQRFYPGLKTKLAPGLQEYMGVTPDQIPEEATPEVHENLKALVQARMASGERKLMEVSPGATVIDPANPRGGAVFTAPKPETAEKTHVVTVPGQDGRPIQRAVTETELRAGVPVYREPKAPDDEPLVAVIGDDGNPVLMPRSLAAGRRPASSREQGRPVTSGDAGRIADFTTSLDDLDQLAATLRGSKSTGASAAVGAALPNVVTELTGWGTDAKQKQAVIDRVKQVIGKTLEGGVLRAEDERKYSKILPVIGDPPEVVSTKLDGLRRAIEQRQERFVESLSDAGYDTTKYSERSPRGGDKGPKRIASDDDYDALPSGALFIDPEGRQRRKP